MLRMRGATKKTISGALACAALSLAAGSALAGTPFQNDVTTSINMGIEWLATNNAFTGGAGDVTGLATQALLEKRASGNPADPPSGYVGASAVDKGRLRSAVVYMINQTQANGAGMYSYRDGQRLFALSGYALTGGPDKSVLGTTITIKQAMDALTDKLLTNQNAQGYWCYNNGGCNDSSTTQFASAGLEAARTFYLSPASGDTPYADAARAASITTALTNVAAVYAASTGTGSDNASCNVLSATERGHGYHAPIEGYKPSLQQTASGIYIQLFGGSDVNSPGVQHYMEWIKNRYRYSDLDSMGNSWPSNSYSYYLWSSFKGMELIRQSGVAPNVGNVGPNDYGTLPAASSPACVQRQVNKDPATLPQVALFGAGPVGYYTLETKGQYFDYAHEILGTQQVGGGYFGNLGVGAGRFPWENFSHQSYMLLVLQRSTGNVQLKCDVNGDGKIDSTDIKAIMAAIGKPPVAGDVRDFNGDGVINIVDVRQCTLQCTNARCAP